jgi:YjbE family integral membrane protein
VRKVFSVEWEFILSWLKIIVIDLTLAGDNAVVIAMAVRTLPRRQQRQGVFWGAMGAVVLRVALTFVASQILQLPFLQLVGGVLLIWVAFKLLRQDSGGEANVRHGTTLLEAIRIIIIADLIMSTDNILAIAGASAGSFFLLLFGLGLSIPIVVMGAVFIATLMNRYGWIVYVGAGILGEVSGKMMLDDGFVKGSLGETPKVVEWVVRIGLAALIVLIGMVLSRRSQAVRDSEAAQ